MGFRELRKLRLKILRGANELKLVNIHNNTWEAAPFVQSQHHPGYTGKFQVYPFDPTTHLTPPYRTGRDLRF